ncbi:MAG: hypothetical protein DWP97_12240 [Calditrichaeota bacterium]|nr:MAG: hypothetical protein DWP97_12240 [Calditrichota bacterium]
MAYRKTSSRRSASTRKAAPRKRVARKVSRPWSREEMSFMRKYYRRFETAWVARQLGRTVYSVRYKAVDLSLKKASPSVWRGNKGPANAFKKAYGSTARKTTRRATTRRSTSRSRSWKASSAKTRRPRKAVARRKSSRR